MSRAASIARALTRRVVSLAASAGVAVCLVLVLFAAVPGDAIDALPNGPEVRAQLAADWGLEGGFGERVGGGLSRVLRGDLGRSLTWRPGAPVGELVAQRARASAALLAPALLLGLAGGYLTALASPRGATGARRALGRALAALSSVPVVLLGLGVVTGVNAAVWRLLEAGWIQRPAWFALPEEPGLVRGALAVGVLALGSARLAQLAERARGELDTLGRTPFLEAERARGAPLAPRVLHHLLVPTCRLAADQIAPLLAALLVVERAFGLPGAGTLFWEACGARDWPLAVGVALAAALTTAAARLAADTLAVLVDPREREGVA